MTSPDQFELLPGAAEAIALLKESGFKVIVITNQRGIALGRMTEADLERIHRRLADELARSGAGVDAIYVCPHGQGECDCRKPEVGLVLRAAREQPDVELEESVVIGDSPSDAEVGTRLGLRTILVGGEASEPTGAGVERARSLLHAARRLAEERRAARSPAGSHEQPSGATPSHAQCPCCTWPEMRHLRDVDSFPYFQCPRCEGIFLGPEHLDEIDAGRELRSYDLDYWTEELPAARDRAYGSSLARMAEALYYARRPIRRFLDVGSGPGFFLDAVAKYLPGSAHVFYGVEKFPPPPGRRTTSPRYLVGELSDLELTFDGGICVEVAEHLTPNTLRRLVLELARVSSDGALYVFNSGMPDYVLNEDPAYLDPLGRGHVASYSVRSLRYLLDGSGFTVFPILGKTWAVVLEYRSRADPGEDVTQRVWSPVPENVAMLDDPEMGSVLKVLGQETILAYRP